MRRLCLLLCSIVMLSGSCFILVAASGGRFGVTVDGIWYDVGIMVLTLALIKTVFWSVVVALGFAYFFQGDKLLGTLREKTELSMSRAAEAIKDLILDLGASSDASPDAGKPELGTESLPALSAREFVLSMRGKTEQTLAQVAETINQAHTGQEIAACEEQIRILLSDLRFDAMALALQMRNEMAATDPIPATPSSAAIAGLSTKSGKAKSYAASAYWRPVWVERYRSMRAADTAIRLADRARRQSAEEY